MTEERVVQIDKYRSYPLEGEPVQELDLEGARFQRWVLDADLTRYVVHVVSWPGSSHVLVLSNIGNNVMVSGGGTFFLFGVDASPISITYVAEKLSLSPMSADAINITRLVAKALNRDWIPV